MSTIEELRALGLTMGTVYANGLHVSHTTDEAKAQEALRLGAFVTPSGSISCPSWEVRASTAAEGEEE